MSNFRIDTPAFPVSTADELRGHQDSAGTWQYPGMTLRDYLAAKAMQAYLSSYPEGVLKGDIHDIAADSWDMADAMLATRSAAPGAMTAE